MAGKQDFSSAARAQIAAMEYTRARDELSELRAALDDEGRALRTMKLLFVPVAIAAAVLFAGSFLLNASRYTEGYDPVSVLLSCAFAVLFSIGMGAWLGCVPAGFIGMTRAFRRSGWFVGGSWVVFLVLFFVLMAVPFLLGPVFLGYQAVRVNRLKAGVAAAKGRFAAASSSIN